MSAEIEGMPEIRARLKDFSERSRSAVQREVKRAALDVESGAKSGTPVDTGRLRNSISHRMEDDFSAVVGTNVEYAPHVHFGTSRMRARPFLFNALEKERAGFQARIAAAVRGEMR